MEHLDIQKRLIIALVLSFLVFIVYDLIFPKPTTQKNDLNKSQSIDINSNNSDIPISTTASSSIPAKVGSTNLGSIKSSNVLVKINSKKFDVYIDKLGRISQYVLKEEKYKTDKKNLFLLNENWVKPLEIRFLDKALNEEGLKTEYSVLKNEYFINENKTNKIILTQKLSKTTVTKEIIFYKDSHYDINITLSTPQDFFITNGERPDSESDTYMVVRGSLIKKNDNTIEIIEDGDGQDAPKTFHNAKFISSFDRYYASILYNFKSNLNVSNLVLKENALLFIQSKESISLHGYIGPKELKVLENIHIELRDALEYGWFTFIAKPLFIFLAWINSFCNNWGWSIIILTIIIKFILFPLSYKGMLSMQKLKDLAPKMKEIKDRYGKEPQKMNQHMMELYKKNNANPIGGCLPILIQIPIFFAIYRDLLNAVELKGAEWILWIDDLSKYDSFFILPILMGASMWYQQRITPNTMTDPMQRKIFEWLPVVMTIFFITFPAGLVLYWLINNLLTIIQQFIINNIYEKNKLRTAK